MNHEKLTCPTCSTVMEVEPHKNAYCKTCDVTYESNTEIEDIIIMSFEIRLTGKSAPGIVPDDHKFL